MLPVLKDVRPIDGAAAKNYLEHIKRILTDASNIYAGVHGLDGGEVLEQVKSKIMSTLSDRAKVNSVVSRLVGEWVGHDVLDLNCNIHLLDGLSISFRKLFKNYEDEKNYKSDLFGTDSALVKIINNTT